MATGYINGHKIYYNYETAQWNYCDDHSPININPRPCIKCNQHFTEDGHDYCIRNLSGVANACCGHGVKEGYSLKMVGLFEGIFQ